MSTNEVAQKSELFLSKRRLGWAGVVAFVGCVAWCALPVLVAVGVGSGAAATVTRVLKPGLELIVGFAVFAIALGVMAIRRRSGRRRGGRAAA